MCVRDIIVRRTTLWRRGVQLSSQTDESKGTKWDLASQAGVGLCRRRRPGRASRLSGRDGAATGTEYDLIGQCQAE